MEKQNTDFIGRTFIHRVNSEGKIIFIGDTWKSFAHENKWQPAEESNLLNQPLWQYIASDEVQIIYKTLIDRVTATEKPVTVPFRCDSPACRRFLEMEIAPFEQETIEFKSRIVGLEYRPPVTLLDIRARRSERLLSICSWCKKVKIDENEWVEVEVAVQKLDLFSEPTLPALTHGICSICCEMWGGEEVDESVVYR